MYIDSKDPAKQKNIHYFTFKDGTQMKAPFTINEQQTDALNAIDDFIKSRDNVMILSRYAALARLP